MEHAGQPSPLLHCVRMLLVSGHFTAWKPSQGCHVALLLTWPLRIFTMRMPFCSASIPPPPANPTGAMSVNRGSSTKSFDVTCIRRAEWLMPHMLPMGLTWK